MDFWSGGFLRSGLLETWLIREVENVESAIQNNFGTQHILQMFLASEKDLPVINIVFLVLTIMNHNEQVTERSKCSNGHLLRLVGCYLGLFKRLKITRTLKVTNKLDQL